MKNETIDFKEFKLTNAAGMEVNILNYGGTIKNVLVPGRNKKKEDMVLGFDTPGEYAQKENPFFGCITGRYANRIARGKFTIDGIPYQVTVNDDGNTLHGGDNGFNRKFWKSGFDPETNTLRLFLISPDGDEGFPGTLSVEVAYTLTGQNELKINYRAATDKPTPVNLTNHSYFNLSAGQDTTIDGHEISIHSDSYIPVDAHFLPTGKPASVKGTPMDFRSPEKIGKDLHHVPGGFDHTWILDKKSPGSPELAVTVFHSGTGRYMEVFTTQPGVQFYTGNFLDGTLTGKNGIKYPRNAGFCLETQHFPDSPNQPSFPNTILRPGERYDQTTIYKFSER